MNRLEDKVLKNDIVHAQNCIQGLEFYKDRDQFLATQYRDTLQDLFNRKKVVEDLTREVRLLENALWMLEHGELGDIKSLIVIDAIIKASVRLQLVKQAKAIATGNHGELLIAK